MLNGVRKHLRRNWRHYAVGLACAAALGVGYKLRFDPPAWLPPKERAGLELEYGRIPTRWAEAMLPKGTPIEKVGELAERYRREMLTRRGIVI